MGRGSTSTFGKKRALRFGRSPKFRRRCVKLAMGKRKEEVLAHLSCRTEKLTERKKVLRGNK